MSDLNLERVSDTDEAGETGSALSHIRGLYRNASRERRLALPVPEPMGKFVKVRYRARDDFEHVESRTGQDSNLDYLIHLCDGILVKTSAGWEPLADGEGDPVLFYPDALRELLGIDVPPASAGGTPREAVLALFVGAPLPNAAVGDHVLRVNRWMQTGQSRVDEEELLGES